MLRAGTVDASGMGAPKCGWGSGEGSGMVVKQLPCASV